MHMRCESWLAESLPAAAFYGKAWWLQCFGQGHLFHREGNSGPGEPTKNPTPYSRRASLTNESRLTPGY